ncbi:nitrogenase molybdenum-iron protein alpha chain [Nostoc sp. CENA67]|uniref:Nitrogenase protein alpha chain n=1 Tax=Amazonocrinis nigriterrae CENA67 TaxID=2794033 RepID=A0A8J7I168_9NOST|nr:nitrogenase molybdenum-iron protein alpha chain [Amazonocrinis nigriterrae]MBH8566369.1 nitrogenase molybdenum-iron protein alpha chain [Amazonocrinis nigriterrae CENA67]
MLHQTNQQQTDIAQQRKQLIEEVLKAYPDKSREKRDQQLNVYEQGKSDCGVKSNVKSIPGTMTARGCSYAGAKGVVWGPIKDMVHISHGPVGCGYWSWSGRRNYYIGTTGIDSFGTMDFTSDFQERDIVFGGDKKLTKIIKEIEELFPLNRGITVQSECPIGLIGDDIEAVAKKSSKEINKPIIPVRCEGFRGVSQSLGHHIANDTVRDWLFPYAERAKKQGKLISYQPGPYDVAIIGDYNIGGDTWSSRILLEEIGLRVIAQWSGDGTLNEMMLTPQVKLNLIHCYRSMNYITRHMEEAYGVPWLEYNFFGPTAIANSLQQIAARFDSKIQENAQKVIAKYEPIMDAVIAKYRSRLENKTVALMVGGLRPRHVIPAFNDLGMKLVATGYEFAHHDDYKRTTNYVENGTIIYDDVTSYEFEELIKALKPDLVASGVKEKYVFQKMGLPFRQMHSWDYSGPYHGYDGFAIFARDMDMALNNPSWRLIPTPWKQANKD